MTDEQIEELRQRRLQKRDLATRVLAAAKPADFTTDGDFPNLIYHQAEVQLGGDTYRVDMGCSSGNSTQARVYHRSLGTEHIADFTGSKNVADLLWGIRMSSEDKPEACGLIRNRAHIGFDTIIWRDTSVYQGENAPSLKEYLANHQD
ncbi:hypothetical protein HOA92_06965 [archaeon]|nr:hypothetical protein [archaeon]MBT6762753.1 hypothetical protein [archaeon]